MALQTMTLQPTARVTLRVALLALWLGLGASLVAAPLPGFAQSLRAISVTVDAVNADATLSVTLGSGQGETLRLAGITVPDCVREDATARLAGLTWGRVGFVEPDQPQRDAYGQLLGYLRVDGVLVNFLLVADGYAVPVDAPSRYAADLSAASDKARAGRLGVWSAACRG